MELNYTQRRMLREAFRWITSKERDFEIDKSQEIIDGDHLLIIEIEDTGYNYIVSKGGYHDPTLTEVVSDTFTIKLGLYLDTNEAVIEKNFDLDICRWDFPATFANFLKELL